MSATRFERESALANRDDWNRQVTARGHQLRWALAPNATRRGHAYYWIGTCSRCDAQMSVAASWTSCGGLRDVRTGLCPGSTELTEGEQDQQAGMQAAIDDFVAAIRGQADQADAAGKARGERRRSRAAASRRRRVTDSRRQTAITAVDSGLSSGPATSPTSEKDAPR